MAHLGSCPSDVFRGRDPCLLSGVSRRIVAFDVVAYVSVCALLLRLSMSRARPLYGGARVFRARVPSGVVGFV